MKKVAILLITFVALSSCKKNIEVTESKVEVKEAESKVYPENISNIFEAHGGIDTWNDMENLTFGMQKGEDIEMTTTALKSRKSVIETVGHKLGFDGTNVWLQNKDTMTYKGKDRAKFYYNLMFYFYAMPFVLADDGISYKDADALEVNGKQYPGIHISYDAGVGESPDDEYILYYDDETKKMVWLAYTVTFFSKEKATKYNLIKYSDWQEVEGLQLPSTLQWHVYKDGIVGDMRNEVKFTEVSISKEMDALMFVKPENAETIE